MENKNVPTKLKSSLVTNENFKMFENYLYNTVMNLVKTKPTVAAVFEQVPSLNEEVKEIISDTLKDFQKRREIVQVAEIKTNKFIKVAQVPGLPAIPSTAPISGAGGGAGGASGILSAMGGGDASQAYKSFENILKGDWQELVDVFLGKKFKIAAVILKALGVRLQRAIKQNFNPEMIRRTYILNTMKDFSEKRQDNAFSTSAFEHILESKGPRGYGGKEHSQGAYEVRGKEIKDEIDQYKKSNPEMFKHEYSYLDDPDVKERLEKNSSNKFRKLVSAQKTQQQDEQLEAFKKLIPKWNANNIKQDLTKIAMRNDITDEQKQELTAQTLSAYIKQIQPLHEYITKIRSGK
jgi:hypothetical protein